MSADYDSNCEVSSRQKVVLIAIPLPYDCPALETHYYGISSSNPPPVFVELQD